MRCLHACSIRALATDVRYRIAMFPLFLAVSGTAVWAQSDFVRLKSFGNQSYSAATPWCIPIEGKDGRLYGTTYEGGSNDWGTVFAVNKDGSSLTILHSFVGAPKDGKWPQGGLIEGTDGRLYGTTSAGGQNNLGTVFTLAEDGSAFSVIKYIATTAEGSGPQAPLFLASDGALYGVTATTVFKVATDGSGFKVLHTFGGGADGANPQFGVREASDGRFYGTTVGGGSNSCGTVFGMDSDGNNYAVLFNFALTNGRAPQAPVIEASDGMLYGTTSYRRTNSYGTIFQIAKDGSRFATLHDFSGANSDGWYPQSTLVEGDDGALYGTCTNGGAEGQGMVFKINKDGSGYTGLHDSSWANADGRVPLAGLCKAGDGRLYGTTSRGGTADYGGMFGLDQNGSNYVMLTSFSWTGGEGWNPQSDLLEASDGWLYGTTCNGGSNEFGTIFCINKDKSGFVVLHHFGREADGACPKGGLIEGADGSLYGTAIDGGTNGFGTIFRLQKNGGDFAVLHHFSGLDGDGSHPQSALLLGSDGALYGTTAHGGSNGWGTIFTINQDGTGFAVLRSIPGTSGNEITPIAPLLEASDGMLYGSTDGYDIGAGTLFRMAKGGSAFATVYQFATSSYGSNGVVARLIEGTNGALYGTSLSGGSLGRGFVFTINKDGSGFTNLHTINSNPDGVHPAAGLTLAKNGILYGATKDGSARYAPSGSTNAGTIFSLAQDGGAYKILRSFDDPLGGRNPVGSLILAGDGAFYGTASAGGDMAGGTLFAIGGPPAFAGVSFSSAGALLSLQGISGRSYGILSTTNFFPDSWQLLPGLATGSNGAFFYLDATATNRAATFYRAQTE